MKARQILKEVITNLFNEAEFSLEHPADEKMGDYATNVAMILAKKSQKPPREVAETLVKELRGSKEIDEVIEKIEVAGPGFINFFLTDKYLSYEMDEVVTENDDYGKGLRWDGKKVMVEYTDPNPFKQFHIGHLMSNTIGESLSRLVEFSGGEVRRACYQGDVGMHVAKSIWGLRELLKEKNQTMKEVGKLKLEERAAFLGKAYAMGAAGFEENEKVKDEINELNKTVYDRSDEEISAVYDLGRQWSLDYFETIYKRLGTKFNFYFFESEAGPRGMEIVRSHIDDGVFEESEGAVVFKGEKYGLHTRVFMNSLGLPTYEAKELGLAQTKYERFAYDKSIIITGNEINEYFRVLIKAMTLIYPELAAKQTHIGHGMLNLKHGKMSSRTGNVVTGESLLDEAGEEIRKKMEETGKIKEIDDVDKVINTISVGAIKYSMLKQSPGKDIVFDFETSLSFEGDSGPYLQYAYARAMSLLTKSKKSQDKYVKIQDPTEEELIILRWIYRFEEVADLATKEMAPNFICSFLIELASRFNHFYAECQVMGSDREAERLKITSAFAQVIKNGLWLLGIDVVERM